MDPQLLKQIPLSEEQLPALSLEPRNLFVSAGAGSGKTRVLIARFAHLVLEGEAPIPEILAITFTERAASEMKRRLVDLFQKMGREDLKREVEEAYVSTFHSFASRVLKEYALEAGIDPEFQVLTEDERAALELELWESILEDPGLQETIYPLLLLSGSSEKLREETLATRSLLTSSALRDPWNALEPSLDRRELLGSFHNTIRTMEDAGKWSPSESKVLDAFRLAVKEFQLEDPVEPQLIREAASFTMSGKRPEWREMLEEMRDRLKDAVLLLDDAKNAPHRGQMRKLLEEFSERLGRKKKEAGLLDFDDLLGGLLALLCREDFVAQAVREGLQKKFKFILMDELQDSNPVEAEILARLSTGKNLFLVGDAKQSIYAFRQAEVGIFLGLEAKAKDEGGFLSLKDNYRSNPEILDFVNGLFSEEVFSDSVIPYEILRPQTDPRGLSSVECLAVFEPDEEKQEPKKVRQVWEAEAVAERFASLAVSKDFPGLRYGDMALLLKNFTDVSIYERALRGRGIPYTVIAGRGFYQKSEVLDLVSFLKLVENPLDDIALAAVLRSSLVNLSDDALVFLAEERKLLAQGKEGQVYLWSAIRRDSYRERLGPKDTKALRNFLNLQHRLSRQKSQLAIGGVLREIILSTQYDTKVLLESEGKRKFSNLEKLCELAKPFDKRNLSLAAFLKNLERMTVKEVRESEAQCDTQNEDTVKILTVHKAKGLEFRVVAAANFDVGKPPDQSLCNFSKKWGLGFRLNNDEGKSLADYRFSKNKELEDRSRDEEAKRLFYVTCTRAKDHLVLSTAPGRESKSFLAQILAFLNCPKGEEGVFKGVQVRVVGPKKKEGAALTSLIEDTGFLRTFLAGRKSIQRPAEPSLNKKWAELYERVLKSDFPTYQGLDISVTSLLEYQDCPKQYYFHRILGFPSGMPLRLEKASEEERGEEEMRAADYGTLFHSILEHWEYSGNLLEVYDREKARIRPSIPELSRVRLEKELYLFAMSRLAHELKGAGKIERELSFEWLPRGLLRVRGQIDLLYLSAGGEWNLVDYKTNRIGSTDEMEEKKEHYQLQLSTYGAVLMRVLSLPSLQCSLYFSTRGESVSWALKASDAKRFEAGLLKTLDQITAQKFPLNRGPLCAGCSFRKPCFENFVVESPSHETAGSL